MDDNREQQLKEKIKHGQKTVCSLLEEYGSLLLKRMQIETTDDSARSVEQAPIVDDANKQLMDFDLAMESIQQQIKLAREKYLHHQPALHTSDECSTIQNYDSQKEVNNELINKQVKLSDDNIGQIEDKLNPTAHEPQALFTGTLPDDFYLLLMSVMGIQECLISNRLVCSFWNELVLERCRNQKSLKLFENFANLMEYSELLLKFEKLDDTSLILQSIGDDLIFELLETDHEKLVNNGWNPEVVLTREKKQEASKVLTNVFPSVEQLVLCPDYDTFINIEHILQFYAKQVTSLTMTNFGPLNENLGRKLSFPVLKSLNTFNFFLEEDQLLSLLPQLESLSLRTTEISLETLLRTGTQLQELNIANIKSVYSSQVDQFSKRSPISTNLRKFTFDATENELQTLEFISLNLTSLECLKLNFRNEYPNVQLYLLISYLFPLHQLHSLTLQTSVSFLLNDMLAEIQPLSSVRHLKLLLSTYTSLYSMDRFSRAIFTAFPNVEQVLIAFRGSEDDGLVDTDTFAAFESFAGKHSTVVQLFRSKTMSKLTKLPNAVAPMLGHRRQIYEEYIEEEELFGMPIFKLTANLVKQEEEDRPNLKITLRPADRLTAMYNLFQLLESDAFKFTFEKADLMIEHMGECALKYGPSESALFSVTCKCILFLLDCNVVEEYDSDDETSFLYTEDLEMYPFLKLMLNLVKHYKTQQFNDKDLLLQICKCIVRLLKEFKFLYDGKLGEYKLFKILLKLADYYKTQQLSVFENDKYLLFEIRELMDDLLKMFHKNELLKVISEFIGSRNRVYRVEVARALLRSSKRDEDYFE